MEIIKISKINKFYGTDGNRVHILKDIDLGIEKGDFVSIMGQSGSGKSTLMNILGCLDTPDSGTYFINGIETGKMKDEELALLRSKTFGFIFQRYNLLPDLSALENVCLPAVYCGTDTKERSETARKLLCDVGLSDKINNKPNELSGGQQQRVSISRALINGGEIILADEPTGALDSDTGKKVMALIKELHKKGHTIIIVTHDKNIAQTADRIIEIKDGKIISDIKKNERIFKAGKEKTNKQETILSYLKDKFLESSKMALKAIVTHKMRSVLTMVGIILGVSSMVSVVSLGRGSEQMIIEKISQMGSNTISVHPGKNFGDEESDKVKTLVVSDAEFLARQNYIESATPEVPSTGNLVYGNFSAMACLVGAGARYFDVTNTNIIAGRNFTREEVQNSASVAVIDDKILNDVFKGGTENAVGKIIMINKKPLRVIGIAKQPFTLGPYSNMLTVWAPYTTAMKKVTGAKSIDSIIVKISDNAGSYAAQKDIEELLTMRHGKKDFFTVNSDSIQKTVKGASDIMTLLVSAIALISLLVGGVGVMNIMLVSVTERTKEIGIRMAIGASRENILEQFLIEAVIVCVTGGVAGILISAGICFIVNLLPLGMSLSLHFDAVLIALGCSTAIGIIFGFMPAKNASALSPIEALARD